MATATDNSIIGGYETSLTMQSNTDRVATDKNTFLKLLVAQLTHQDPLNPVEDKEFIAQLAQFTSVEELQNLNKGMESLNESYLRQQTVNAVSFIGKRISAKGDNVTIANIGSTDEENPAYSTPLYYTLPQDASEVRFTVKTVNSDGYGGRVVTSYTKGAHTAGSFYEQWDGMDGAGNPMPDGTYVLEITAYDANGNSMLVTTSSIGTVIGVETQADGNHKLMLEDGRSVYFNDIEFINDPTLTSSGSGGNGETDDGSTGEGSTEGGETEGGATEDGSAEDGGNVESPSTAEEGSTTTPEEGSATSEESAGA